MMRSHSTLAGQALVPDRTLRYSTGISPRRTTRQGFSLVEVALSIAIVAIVVLAAVGLLVPAQRSIDDTLTAGQASRLRHEIEQELNVLRPSEKTSVVTTPFDKAYMALKVGDTQDGLLMAFFYRAKMDTTLVDGRVAPYVEPTVGKRVGEDYILQAAVMDYNTFKAKTDFLRALDGKLYVVRIVPLEGMVSDTTATTPFVPLPIQTGSSTPLKAFLQANPPNVYPVAVLPATAEFYVANDLDNPVGIYQNINKGIIKPVVSLNIAFNR